MAKDSGRLLLKFKGFCTFLASSQDGAQTFCVWEIQKTLQKRKISKEKATRHSEDTLVRVQAEKQNSQGQNLTHVSLSLFLALPTSNLSHVRDLQKKPLPFYRDSHVCVPESEKPEEIWQEVDTQLGNE